VYTGNIGIIKVCIMHSENLRSCPFSTMQRSRAYLVGMLLAMAFLYLFTCVGLVVTAGIVADFIRASLEQKLL
jgi:hypothetical protein